MKLSTIGALSTSVLLATVFQAMAQDAPALPKVLRIYREEIKQGKATAHEKTEAAFAKMLARNKYPNYSLGCTVVAGPTEAWFFEAHDSLMSIEKVMTLVDKNPAMRADFANLDGLDSELRTNSTVMIAVLRDDLSYKASEFAADLGKTRFFAMTIMRIRPYTDMLFAEGGKQVIAAYEKSNSEVPSAIYQVVSGGFAGTYLVFAPMKSLETMDGSRERARAMMEAMGRDNAAALYKGASEIITGSQLFLLAINPKMSYVSKEMAAADPDFWTPKTAATPAKPAAPKAAEKSGGQ